MMFFFEKKRELEAIEISQDPYVVYLYVACGDIIYVIMLDVIITITLTVWG